jgi:hypothetical protein
LWLSLLKSHLFAERQCRRSKGGEKDVNGMNNQAVDKVLKTGHNLASVLTRRCFAERSKRQSAKRLAKLFKN